MSKEKIIFLVALTFAIVVAIVTAEVVKKKTPLNKIV